MFSEANRGSDNGMITIGLAVCSNMKRKSIGSKPFLDPSSDIVDRCAP